MMVGERPSKQRRLSGGLRLSAPEIFPELLCLRYCSALPASFIND
jgi:hypothetical protein